MISVRSSAIDSVGYDQDACRLFIKFKNNHRIYTFYNVPAGIYIGMMHATSKGAYYDTHINGKFGG